MNFEKKVVEEFKRINDCIVHYSGNEKKYSELESLYKSYSVYSESGKIEQGLSEEQVESRI